MRLVSGLTAGLTAEAITRTDGRTDLRRNNYRHAEFSPSVPRAHVSAVDVSDDGTAALRASLGWSEPA